jgi:hypothetical protein
VLTHPTIWPHISEGVDVSPEEYDPPIDDSDHFIRVQGGLFILHPYEDGWKIHANMIERGRAALNGYAIAEQYALENGIKRLYAVIPEINPNVRAFAESVGFSEYQFKDGEHYMKQEIGA